MAQVRNFLAHWPEDDKREPPSVDARLLANISLPWVLRTVLLRKADIDIDAIRQGYSEDSRFSIYRANLREILASGLLDRDGD